MKRFATIVVTVLVAAFLMCTFATMNANAADKYLKIGYSMPAATAGYMARAIYWAKKGMADWMAKDRNIEFLYVNAENVTKQANDIEDLMAKGINVLIVWPYDASVTSVIEKAYKSGIYTVVMDRGTSKVCYDVYLSNDDEGYTREGTEWLCKQLNYRGNLVIIEGIPCPINTVRIETIRNTAAQYPGIKILDSQPGNWRKDQALAIMENYLQKYRRIDAVYTADDDMMLGALQAYKESGRRDIKYFLGGACDKNVIKMIMDGSEPLVQANVTYPPDQCATVVGVAILGARGKNFEGFYQKKLPVRIILAAELVTKENAASYYFPDEP
jgi:ribose transport system substrate-binding protein